MSISVHFCVYAGSGQLTLMSPSLLQPAVIEAMQAARLRK
jgi:hypothetical protein